MSSGPLRARDLLSLCYNLTELVLFYFQTKLYIPTEAYNPL